MKKMLMLLLVAMLYQATGVSQACEDTPIVVASSAYTVSGRTSIPGNTLADLNSGMEFVHVTGGCYCMGADARSGLRDATPTHEVCVDDYYIGKYEVTQAQWREIMGSNPSTVSSCGDNCPVVDVSWQEVQEFTRRLNERTGKTYRLPTEAEWEYAVRSGGMQEPAARANAASADGKRVLRPIGWSQPNGLGIYDMQGSVWEWTNDWYSTNYYKQSQKFNPEGPENGHYRVLRGGSWDDTAQSIQPTMRVRYEPWVKRSWVGFRLLSPDQYSAKFKHAAVVALKENANQSSQCEPVREALIR
jgi:sulfatase modifying factor 1